MEALKRFRGKPALLMSSGVIIGASIFLLANPSTAFGVDEKSCLTCHGDPKLNKVTPDGTKISLFVSQKTVASAAHRYIDCSTCHTGDPHQAPTALDKVSLAEKCGTCHKTEYKLHLESVHGQQLVSGNRDVATCVDCHSNGSDPHGVIRVLEYQAPAYKKNIAETCAKCHGDETLMASYGIVEKVYESYLRSFHGKAMQLGTFDVGQLDKATCTNCHGVHDIKSVTDPNSPVAGLDNLAVTCEQCHAGAGIEFARGFLGHREASLDNVPMAYQTEVLFTILLRSVLGFGAFVVVAAVIRFSINRWRE